MMSVTTINHKPSSLTFGARHEFMDLDSKPIKGERRASLLSALQAACSGVQLPQQGEGSTINASDLEGSDLDSFERQVGKTKGRKRAKEAYDGSDDAIGSENLAVLSPRAQAVGGDIGDDKLYAGYSAAEVDELGLITIDKKGPFTRGDHAIAEAFEALKKSDKRFKNVMHAVTLHQRDTDTPEEPKALISGTELIAQVKASKINLHA